MYTERRLRVAIDCRIESSREGTGTAVLALAKALSESTVTDQEYTFIVREDLLSWLEPYVYGPCKLVGIPASRLSIAKSFLRRLPPLRYFWRKLRSTSAHIPMSDGYIEEQKFDVVHFPTQIGYVTKLPSVYQPWDLQHLHYPQFFSKDTFDFRERSYRAYCAQAAYVCVQAEWTKQDLVKHYGLNPDKVVVIPWGSAFDAYEAPSPELKSAMSKKYMFPAEFFFYPAVTWPHKNHEVIIRALHVLQSKHGIFSNVYFTGYTTKYRRRLEDVARSLGVAKHIHFLGFLTTEELQVVFGAATAMVFPSRFEGFGLPILEAFHAQLPVICSNASTLPEVAGEAALYFDPGSPEALAALMKTVLEAPGVREDLIKKGTLALSRHSIKGTAAALQGLYRRIASKRREASQLTVTPVGNWKRD